MTEVTLHATPRYRDVLVEQIRIVGLSLRREALVVAAFLGVATILVVGEVLLGGRGFDSRELFPTPLLAFFFPFAVWRREQRFGPAFLWTLPVERRRLALAKVFAGGVWLTAGLALFAVWLLVLTLLAGVSPALAWSRVPMSATIAAYLLGSALVLGLRHPVRWLAGTAGLFLLLAGVSQAFEQVYGVRTLLGSSTLYFATNDAGKAWLALPDPAQWAIATFVLWGAGLLALWAAASRHVERRRH